MHKIFVNNGIFNDMIEVSGEDFNHIKALRLKINDRLIICDGNNQDYFCEIKTFYRDHVSLLIRNMKPSETEPKTKIFLFQAMPKQDKFEYIIQKATELGVNKIIPVVTEYCEAKKNPSDSKISRWRKIAKSAAEQSGRGIIPEISVPICFTDAIILAQQTNLNLIAHEKSNNSIREELRLHNLEIAKAIGIFIGPEGGFSEQEINSAKQNKIMPVSLGSRILRTETASLFVVSTIIFSLEL